MLEHQSSKITSFVVEAHQALIAVPEIENGQEVTRYYIGEETVDEALPEHVQEALALAGAWSDLDWQETEEALDRIRHESIPTPPIEL